MMRTNVPTMAFTRPKISATSRYVSTVASVVSSYGTTRTPETMNVVSQRANATTMTLTMNRMPQLWQTGASRAEGVRWNP